MWPDLTVRSRAGIRPHGKGRVIEEKDPLGSRTKLEYDAAGNLTAIIGPLGNSQKFSYCFLYNGHGDVVQTAAADGTVENNYDYDIFGSSTLTIEQYSNAVRYAGEFYDEETGLYYLRARYYNPYTGRFISEDSYWGETDNPLSLNLYTYCHNTPMLCFLRGAIENIVNSNKSV